MESFVGRKIGITDTTLRDSHQSLLATRMKTEDMLPIAAEMDEMGFHSLEVWGGATFDTAMRFLGENPWERLRALRQAFKKTKLQMLLRGQNLVGYKHYADDVVEAFVARAAENGIDIFRVFDALNDIRNMEKAMTEVKKHGKHVQGTMSYTLGPIYDTQYFVDFGKKLRDAGADSICIKDMAGILSPYAAYDLVKALKAEVKLPIQMHTHYTSGMGSMTYLKAIEAGADIIDTANSALALGTSQPATETMVAVLNDAGYETGIDLNKVSSLAGYFKEVRKGYSKFDVYKEAVDVKVLLYQVPGGMLSNFITQLSEQNALDKLDAVLAEVPRVRADFGNPPLVTPSSQIVGSQAVLNVLTGERYKMVTTEVKNYMKGLYGQAPGQVNEEIRKKVIKDIEPVTVRPADLLPPQMEEAKKEIGDLAKNEEELLMYVLFPQVAKPFLEGTLEPEVIKVEEKQEVEKVVEAPQAKTAKVPKFASSLKKMQKGGNITINFNGAIEKLKIKMDGSDFAFDLQEGVTKPVMAPKEALAQVAATKEDVVEGEDITAPMPGKVFKVVCAEGVKVEKGEQILILEAMKMENEIKAPTGGIVQKVHVQEGDAVNLGDILVVIKREE